MAWKAPHRRREWGNLRAVAVTGTVACLGACTPVEMACSVSGLGETEAILTLTQAAGRVNSFRYDMSRPVASTMNECSVSAQRRRATEAETFTAGFEPSNWSDTGEGTRVAVGPDSVNPEHLVMFASRPNGVRLMFLGEEPSCGARFLLPRAVEFRWDGKTCRGRVVSPPRWSLPTYAPPSPPAA